MEQIKTVVETAVEKYQVIILVVTIVFGFLQCFFGYRLLRLWSALIGFGIGFFLGWLITSMVGGSGRWLPLVVGAIIGVLLALAAFKLYLAGVFVYVLIITYQAVQKIPVSGETWKIILIIAGIVLGVLAGVLAVRFSRPLIILVSGITGAVNGISGIGRLVPALSGYFWLRIALIAVLAVLGILVQFKTTKKYAYKNQHNNR